MYIITNKYTNRILSISNDVDNDANGNIIDSIGIGYFCSQVNLYQVELVPGYVEPNRFLYTQNDGFIEDPSYNKLSLRDRLLNAEANIDYLMLLNDTTEE